MQRDLTEFNKLEAYLEEHADEYGIKFGRYDNEDAYPHNKKWAQAFGCEPVDRHILTVWYKNKPIETVQDLYWFNVSCSCGSYGSEDGLLELHGALAQFRDRQNVQEEGWLTANDIIERMEAVR